MHDLTLTPISGEPCVQDLVLARRLGFERPVSIRDLIKRNAEKLNRFSILRTMRKIPDGPGRPTSEYFLDQRQAIFVCMKSETDAAFEVQAEIVRVFDAYRSGTLDHPQEVTRAPEHDVVTIQMTKDEYIAHLEGRLGCSLRVTPPVAAAPIEPPPPGGKRSMSREEDERIAALFKAGWSKYAIARKVGRSARSVSRALVRAARASHPQIALRLTGEVAP